MKVIKRDGKLVEFNISKIERVIELANKSVPTEHRIDSEKMQKILAFVSTQLNKIKETEVPVKDNGETHTVKEKCVEVEKIQDIVEEALMNKNCYEVARAFIACRDERAKERFKRLGITKEIKEKLDASNVQNQNANLDEHSFGGRKGEAESALLKQMALDYYISPKFAKNHINNRIYIHDLDSYVIGMHNCLSLPIDELLANGAVTRQVKIRPAGSVNTAFQLVAVYFQLQSLQQFGGVAATHVDWTMVPYVRKSFMKHYIVAYLKSTDDFVKLNLPDLMFKDYQDEAGIWHNELDDWIDSNKDKYLKELNLSFDDFKFSNKKNLDKFFYQSAMYDTIIEIRQAAEGMFHNLNSLQSRSGNQLPFSSINYGTCTLDEGRVVTRAILETSLKGVGNGETSIFPCQIFQYWKGVNDKPGTPNYDLYKLAIRSTSKRLYPNYCNVDWSNDAGFNKDDPRTYPSTMGCRTYSSKDINAPSEELSHLKDGRGNIAPATIIMPTLAMEAKKKAEKNGHPEYVVDNFLDILEKAISDCKDELIERYNWICAQNPASAKFMYQNNTFFSYNKDFETEGIRGALKHGTLAIGQLGLAETLQILVGCDHTDPRGMAVAKQIEQLFKTKAAEYKENYRLNFGVYFTPAESTCYTAMKKFKKKYGVIPNVSDHDYFTNSIHVPVWKEIDPFEKIDIESQLTGYSSSGCITYVEIGDKASDNLEALEQIVNYAMSKDVPYFALNLPLSHCTVCGSDENIDFDASCPHCGAEPEEVEHLARVTGYLSTTFRHFNTGKQSEVRERYTHVNKLQNWKK